MVTDIFPAICADDVAAARDFYVQLFGFEIIFDSGWYVQLQAPVGPHAQLGIVQRGHDSVPEGFRQRPAGVLIGIEVEDVDAVHRRAAGHRMLLDLRSEPWGQRHFITVDPSGTMVDVITPIPQDAEYAQYNTVEPADAQG